MYSMSFPKHMIEVCASLSKGIGVNTEETQKRERVELVCQQRGIQIANLHKIELKKLQLQNADGA